MSIPNKRLQVVRCNLRIGRFSLNLIMKMLCSSRRRRRPPPPPASSFSGTKAGTCVMIVIQG
uniref:Uncharacterized protein n=1 Tax=Nelumbo nucifera TaxID=4432 RepID=A0A822YCA4_NELNU|nr:TPA_asm: hypothetical protein HUJ06_010595 [Nelumbo nucifera]